MLCGAKFRKSLLTYLFYNVEGGGGNVEAKYSQCIGHIHNVQGLGIKNIQNGGGGLQKASASPFPTHF